MICRSAAWVPLALTITLLASSAVLGQEDLQTVRAPESPGPDAEIKPIPGLKMLLAKTPKVPTLGAADPASGYKLEVELSGWGASILNIYLTDYRETIDEPEPFLVNRALEQPRFMFGVGLDVGNDLDNGVISGHLRQEFQKLGIKLSDYATVIVDDDESGRTWRISDQTEVFFAAAERNRLNIYLSEWIYPFAARQINVNGHWIDLSDRWELLEPDSYRTTLDKDPDAQQSGDYYERAVYATSLIDENDQTVLEIRRTYIIDSESYELLCIQHLINRSNQTLQIVWEQNAQGDIPNDDASYLGDRRNVVAGYYDLEYDTYRRHVSTKDTFLPRSALLPNEKKPGKSLFPGDLPGKLELVWIAALNRYFGVAVSSKAFLFSVGLEFEDHLDTLGGREMLGDDLVSEHLRQTFAKQAVILSQDAKADVLEEGSRWQIREKDTGAIEGNRYTVEREGDALNVYTRSLASNFRSLGKDVRGRKDNEVLMFTLSSDPLVLDPGQEVNLDLSLFVGPRKSEILNGAPFDSLELSKIIRYSLGGPCTFFTFQWLAHLLLAFLKLIEAVLGDWGIAIIILVVIVRLLLHPITKKAQVNMTKMGKQMGQLQPEVEKLKKKYKDDQKRLNKEMMQLYREKGINPANILGCLPMFLQMPIWIALYAMLYYAIELRHVPAFYGVFQSVSGGKWSFLADLSSADHFVRFSEGFTLPLIFANPTIDGINILPLLWGVAMFFQQKYMTPPAANEQAAQQQKIMKWMMLLFPIMLYPAPSGLTLYILASTGAGVLDSYMVRRHIKQEEEAGTLFKPKTAKPGGFMERMSRVVEARKSQLEAQQTALRGGQTGKSYKKRKRRTT